MYVQVTQEGGQQAVSSRPISPGASRGWRTAWVDGAAWGTVALKELALRGSTALCSPLQPVLCARASCQPCRRHAPPGGQGRLPELRPLYDGSSLSLQAAHITLSSRGQCCNHAAPASPAAEEKAFPDHGHRFDYLLRPLPPTEDEEA